MPILFVTWSLPCSIIHQQPYFDLILSKNLPLLLYSSLAFLKIILILFRNTHILIQLFDQ